MTITPNTTLVAYLIDKIDNLRNEKERLANEVMKELESISSSKAVSYANKYAFIKEQLYKLEKELFLHCTVDQLIAQVDTIGQDRFEWLCNNSSRKFTIEEIEKIKSSYPRYYRLSFSI